MLVRFLVRDEERVLRSRYGLRKLEIIEAIAGLLDATDVQFEDEPAIEEALFVWKDKGRSRPRKTRL